MEKSIVVTIQPSFSFNSLDDPIIKLILSYLQGTTLCEIIRTNRFLKSAASAPALWKELMYLEFEEGNGNIMNHVGNNARKGRNPFLEVFVPMMPRLQRSNSNGPRLQYLDLCRKKAIRIREEQERIEAEEWERKCSPFKLGARLSFLYGEWFLLFLSFPVGFLAFTAMLSVKLDNASISWGSVFSPLYLLMGFIMFYGLSLLVSRIKNYSIYDKANGVMKEICCSFFHSNAGNEFHPSYLVSVFPTVLVFLTILFIQLRLDEIVLWKWNIVFVPLYLAFGSSLLIGILNCVPEGFDENENDSWVVQLLINLALIPLVIFIALLVTRLDGGDMPLKLMFIPFWIIDGVLHIGLIMMGCAILIELYDNETDWDDFLLCIGAQIILVLFELFKIFLTLKDAGAISWSYSLIFIPLWINLAVAIILSCILTILVTTDEPDYE